MSMEGLGATTSDWDSAAVARLAEEFRGTFNVETIDRVFGDLISRLSASARIETYVPLLAERFTRDRLMAQARIATMTTLPTVLFLCTHNAGRSQMAAGWMKRLASERALVYSGGSEPASEVNPVAIEAMAEVGIDIASQYPKPWTDEVIQSVDVVVTMGCGDACPVFPGVRYIDWELDDPAGQGLGKVREIRDEIEGRVRALLEELGVPASSQP